MYGVMHEYFSLISRYIDISGNHRIINIAGKVDNAYLRQQFCEVSAAFVEVFWFQVCIAAESFVYDSHTRLFPFLLSLLFYQC